MITSAERRQPPVLVIALTLSLLVHLLGLLLYADVAHQWLVAVHNVAKKPPDDLAATSDRITLEKPVSPSASHASVPLPPPQPERRPQRPQPQAVVQAPPRSVETVPPTAVPTAERPTPIPHHEIARVVAKAERQPTPAPAKPPAERKVAYVPPEQHTAPTPSNPRKLTAAQIAALTQQFKTTIATAQADVINGKPKKQQSATRHKYDMQMAGKLADIQAAQGAVEPLAARYDRVHQLDIYYIRVHMVYPDGFAEVVDIPWPVGFPAANDPMKTYGRIFNNIQPPPGWTLPHPFQLSRLLCIYFRDECEAVIDAEEKNGGLPAGATPPPG